jgi:hypothetical protein
VTYRGPDRSLRPRKVHVDSWWHGLTKAHPSKPFKLSQGMINAAVHNRSVSQ